MSSIYHGLDSVNSLVATATVCQTSLTNFYFVSIKESLYGSKVNKVQIFKANGFNKVLCLYC